jgi:tRNA pseudouridine55 synthase
LEVDGALIVDKPSGPTSHDVVAVARRALQTRHIGHAGTLDPLATGVLVLLLGRATRLSQFIVHDDKEYLAGIRLGVSTPTYDAEGLPDSSQRPTPDSQIDQSGSWTWEIRNLDAVLDGFRGTFLQTPPPFSAKKIAGRRAYEHARDARPVAMTPAEVTLHELERLDSADPSLLRLRLVVSSGFYVRSLAHDIGQRLGCGAHLESLRRTRSGGFTIDEAVPLDAVVTGPLQPRPMNRLIEEIPAVTLSDEGLRLASHGNPVGVPHVGTYPPASESGRIRLLAPDGALVAIGRLGDDALLHPQIVLV